MAAFLEHRHFKIRKLVRSLDLKFGNDQANDVVEQRFNLGELLIGQ
ncbi:MAG: hypothetical protein ABI442_18400 [Gemmatimonadaceae bacterium]